MTSITGIDVTSTDLINHLADVTGNPHSVNATNVGLTNVTNESKTTMFTNPTFTGGNSTFSASNVNITANASLLLEETTGGNSIGLKANTSMAANYEISFPDAQSTADQLMVNDGAGNMSWSDDLTLAGVTVTSLLTVDNADIELGGTQINLRDLTEIQFYETTAPKTGYCALHSPATVVAGSIDYYLPATQGPVNSVWTSDNTGHTTVTDTPTIATLTTTGDATVAGDLHVAGHILDIANTNTTTDTDTMGIKFTYGATPTYTGLFRKEAGDYYLVNSTSDITEAVDPAGLTVERLHSCIPFAHEYMSTPAATTITTKDLAVKVAGTFASDSTCMFTTTGNRLTYTGAHTTQFKIDVSIGFETAAANKKFEFFVSRNDATFSSKGIVVSHTLPTATDNMTASISTIYGLTQNQYLEVWVANLTDTTNLTVNNCSMTCVAVD